MTPEEFRERHAALLAAAPFTRADLVEVAAIAGNIAAELVRQREGRADTGPGQVFRSALLPVEGLDDLLIDPAPLAEHLARRSETSPAAIYGLVTSSAFASPEGWDGLPPTLQWAFRTFVSTYVALGVHLAKDEGERADAARELEALQVATDHPEPASWRDGLRQQKRATDDRIGLSRPDDPVRWNQPPEARKATKGRRKAKAD